MAIAGRSRDMGNEKEGQKKIAKITISSSSSSSSRHENLDANEAKDLEELNALMSA